MCNFTCFMTEPAGVSPAPPPTHTLLAIPIIKHMHIYYTPDTSVLTLFHLAFMKLN